MLDNNELKLDELDEVTGGKREHNIGDLEVGDRRVAKNAPPKVCSTCGGTGMIEYGKRPVPCPDCSKTMNV